MQHMPSLRYQLVTHRGIPCILAQFAANADWNRRMKAVPGCRWSQTLKGWTLPDNSENRKRCRLTTHHSKPGEAKQASLPCAPPISVNNAKQLQALITCLELKAYSESTIRTYRSEFMQLLQLINKVNVQDLKVTDLQRYFLYCRNKGLTENTLNSRINAVKFYYEQILRRPRIFIDIPRPKKPLQLPKLLNETELAKLFNAVGNKKHKAMLFTAYSGGLRVSEVVNLKLADIDSKRMQIFVERAKGKKDRYVNLSPLLPDILRQYIRDYTPRPRLYLFESGQTQTGYPTREQCSRFFRMQKRRQGLANGWVYIV